MLSTSVDLLYVVEDGGGFLQHIAVSSYRGGRLLAADVPVAAASEIGDRSQRVPTRITLTVPARRDGVEWAPGDDVNHPLAAYGQRLRIQVGIGKAGGATEWATRGWYVITDTRLHGDEVTVQAESLLFLVDEARLVSPFAPSGTYLSSLRRLMEPAVPLRLDGVTDRAISSGLNYDEDRLGAALEILDAWPARLDMHPDGYGRIHSGDVDTGASFPDIYLTTADAADWTALTCTIIAHGGTATREGAANVVVARGQAADGGQLQGAAYDTTGGPTSYNGGFSPFPVPYFYHSPLLTTVAQCNAAARSMMGRRLRSVAREWTIEAVPNPLLELGDYVRFFYADRVPYAETTIEKIDYLPLTPGQGPMRLVLREYVDLPATGAAEGDAP